MTQSCPVTAPMPTPHSHPIITPETDCDPTYLLFQQALVERSSQAWETLYARYLPLVLRWVQQEPAFALSEEEAQDFANRAFAKLWRSITPAKFAKFVNVATILQYLHLCVRSVVVDQSRCTQRRRLEVDAFGVDEQRLAGADVAQSYCDDLQRHEFWQRVQASLKNEKERQLLYYRFVLGIKPNHICQQYADTFASPDEVYSLSQNILARLRRDPAIQSFLSIPPN